MWIDPKTLDIALLHSDMRLLRPNWSGPAAMTDDMIAFLGFVPVVTVMPTYDALSEAVTALPVTLIDGVWTQHWQVTALPDEQVKLNKQALMARVNQDIDAKAPQAADAATTQEVS
jgi:hypothetical protein